MTVDKSNKYITSIGRRRSAICSLKLFSTKGSSSINGRELDKYFPSKHHKITYEKPFVVTELPFEKYHFSAKILGGGIEGQIDALSLAISRALIKLNSDNKSVLRSNGLITVDPRVRERRKVGTGGKARRAKQSPKR